jgi:hypothetical protein
VGGALYQGDSGQGSTTSDFGVSIMELHAQYNRGPLRLRALWADASIDDAHLLATASASDDVSGWYFESGWDLFLDRQGQSLIPFVRYERFDLQASSSPNTDVTALTVGVAYQPQPNVTIKLDYLDLSDDADSQVDAFEFTLGWAF